MTDIETALMFGCIGGVASEILGLYNLRKSGPGQYPRYIKSWGYWVPTILMTLMGGGLAAAYTLDGTKLGAILSINIGASAPLAIGAFTKNVPKISE